MSFLCHIPGASLRSALISGLFVPADGALRLATDHWLLQAELLNGERQMLLSSSCGAIEVAGFPRPHRRGCQHGQAGSHAGRATPGGARWAATSDEHHRNRAARSVGLAILREALRCRV